jgi:hypothetical protein
VVGVPIAINESYKIGGYITKWGPADVLAYYGSVVSAIIGIVGVYLTVYISNQNYRDDARSRVLPFIAINVLNIKQPDPFLEGLGQESYFDMGNDPVILDSISGKNRNHLFFIIDGKSKVRVSDSLSDEEAETATATEVIWRRGKDGSLYQRDSVSISMPFLLENIGNGAAKNLRMGLSYSTDKPFFKTEFILKQEETFYVHILSQETFEKIKGKYVFCVYYEDISGNQYEQLFPIKIFEENGNKYKNMNTNGKQRLIGRIK